MIILVWNLGTTGRLLSAPQAPSPGKDVLPSGSARGVVAFVSAGEAARGGHDGGRLTVRQRFLLGRRVDINRAAYQEISGLPGISDSVARAVVEERKRRGAFRRPEDLLAVRGIKEKRLKKILPFIAIIHNN
ncbi:MAG: helix-hairpin-helix domain-containing protein [Candidatus Deferrimicrobiaceae bacterium]